MRKSFWMGMVCLGALGAALASAEPFELLTGVDVRHYPGSERFVPPTGSGFPGSFYDGDRLAGTSDVSADVVPFNGIGTPLFDPNAFGSLSMLFRRGTVPLGPSGVVPLQGIEFLGGPLLDLDGDLDNGVRSLVPLEGVTPVVIPDTASYIDLEFDLEAGTVTLVNFDATGTNEGGPGVPAETATVLITLAGTGPTGELGDPINPDIDTRTGTVTPFTGTSGTLAGVYRIESFGYELWEDTIFAGSSTADVLGTMQFLGAFEGWLVLRDPETGAFPTLTGEGLGSTRWPEVNTDHVGLTYVTAHGLAGGTATILDGQADDQYSAPGNGGLPLTDFGGDLGAYFDNVVVPIVPADADRFVYLESAGFGINNSSDPIYGDTVSYDAVIIAAGRAPCAGSLAADSNCDGLVNAFDIDAFIVALAGGQAAWETLPTSTCDYLCVNDVNGDGQVNAFDIDPFVELLTGQP